MKIYINDKLLLILFEDKDEEFLIRKHFTKEDMSNVYMGGKFDIRKIKKKCFLKKKKPYYYLYSGFLKELLTFSKGKFKITELKDNRTKFKHQLIKYSDEELKSYLPNFDYVEHQVDSLKRMLKTNVGIIQAVTGSGKTEIFIAFLKITKLPTLILVDKISLVLQIKKRIENNGIKNVGICYGKGVIDGDVMISTIGSVGKVPSLRKYKVLIIDECHHSSASRFQDFLSKSTYSIRFGFSATPKTKDDYKWNLIKQHMGDIIYSIGPKILIENKVIAKPIIKFISIESPPTIDWPTANYNCIINNKIRNNKIKHLVKEYNIPTLILIKNIEHGEILNELIDDSVFVSGIDGAEKRQEIINDFENDKIKTVIASGIFNEGISINSIKLLIVASGGKSFHEALQKIGRAMRISESKKTVLIVDFDDYGNKFTEKHSRMRKEIYKKAGFEAVE